MTIKSATQYRKEILNRPYPSVVITHGRVGKNPKGGVTVIQLWIDRGCAVTGFAFCWKFDTYNKRKGKSIAFGRLIRSLVLLGTKKADLRRWVHFIEDRIGTIDYDLYHKARNGDKIE